MVSIYREDIVINSLKLYDINGIICIIGNRGKLQITYARNGMITKVTSYPLDENNPGQYITHD